MEYYVIGSDGNEYGPADIPTLQSWVKENRLSPQSSLRNVASGAVLVASTIPGLFPVQAPPTMGPNQPPQPNIPPAPSANAWSQPPNSSNYLRPTPAAHDPNAGGNIITWSFVESGLSIALLFIFGRYAFILSVFAIVNGFQGKKAGHRLGNVAIIAGFVALAVNLLALALLGIK